MARKLNPQGLISQETYLFPDQAHLKDQVFNTFKTTAQRNSLPVTIAEEVYKSGGLLGSKDVLLTIDGGYKPFCVLGCTTYGNFLSVTLYTLVEDSLGNKLLSTVTRSPLDALGSLGKDMISIRDMQAFVACVSATLEQAFGELSMKEYEDNYKGVN